MHYRKNKQLSDRKRKPLVLGLKGVPKTKTNLSPDSRPKDKPHYTTIFQGYWIASPVEAG
jgi:hypothetical protein